MDVDLPVTDGLPDIFDVVGVGEVAVVVVQTAFDFGFFGSGEEFGTVEGDISFCLSRESRGLKERGLDNLRGWVVVDDPVRHERNYQT